MMQAKKTQSQDVFIQELREFRNVLVDLRKSIENKLDHLEFKTQKIRELQEARATATG